MKGQIVGKNANLFSVFSNGNRYLVKPAGKLRLNKLDPIVGDFVEFTPNEFIIDIYPRKNSLVRPKVSNIDQAVIITSLIQPNYSSILLNKFLAIIENSGIKPIIIFTKADLTDETHLEEYKKQGYETYEISNSNKESVQKLKQIFKDKLTVFTGQTGSGKSSTINNIAELNLKTDEISKALGRGKHTTRLVEIIEWSDGRLIDTPGFSSLDFNMTKLQLARAYHDFELASQHCKFKRTCIHKCEADCEVKRMVSSEKITKQRYADYLRLLEEAK